MMALHQPPYQRKRRRGERQKPKSLDPRLGHVGTIHAAQTHFNQLQVDEPVEVNIGEEKAPWHRHRERLYHG